MRIALRAKDHFGVWLASSRWNAKLVSHALRMGCKGVRVVVRSWVGVMVVMVLSLLIRGEGSECILQFEMRVQVHVGARWVVDDKRETRGGYLGYICTIGTRLKALIDESVPVCRSADQVITNRRQTFLWSSVSTRLGGHGQRLWGQVGRQASKVGLSRAICPNRACSSMIELCCMEATGALQREFPLSTSHSLKSEGDPRIATGSYC